MASVRHTSHMKKFLTKHKGGERTDSVASSAASGLSLERQRTFVVSRSSSAASVVPTIDSEPPDSKPPDQRKPPSERKPPSKITTPGTKTSATRSYDARVLAAKKKVSQTKKPTKDIRPARLKFDQHRRARPTADGMPDELLRYIFSFLNPNDLLLCARVCKRWLDLSNDNLVWQQVYKKYVLNSKRGQKSTVQHPVNPPASYWKSHCIQRCSEIRNKAALAQLKKVSPFTGLPANTQQALKKGGVQWCITFVDTDSEEHVITHRDMFHFSMATCVRWYSLEVPAIARIRKIKIFAANPVFFDGNGRPHPNSPSQRSLLMEVDLQWSGLTPPYPMAAGDDSIKLYILPNNLMIATWKDGGELAFITGNFHHRSLVRRCLMGKPDSPYMEPAHVPVQDDLDSKRGLHGYNATIELRNQRTSFFSQQFRDLYCQPEDIGNGYTTFRLIQEGRNYEHAPIGKKISFPWKTDVFKGILQNVLILDFTLLDEEGNPMWCVSAPVRVAAPGVADIVYDYDWDHFFIDYIDTQGKLKGKLVWEEEIGQYMIMSLDMHLAIKFVNQWFATSISETKRPQESDDNW